MQTPFVTELLLHIDRSFRASSATEQGEALAGVLALLARIEVVPGGPYASSSGQKEEDADIGLNLIIFLFLRSHDVSLPGLSDFIDRTLSKTAPTSMVAGKESLAELVQLYRAPQAVVPATFEHKEEDELIQRIRVAAKEMVGGSSPEIADAAMHVIDRTVQGNPDRQMSLMAWYVRQSLGRAGAEFSDSQVIAFGLANICFWTAFIIYDDFWDEDEAAEPGLLPVANLLARHYIDFFSHTGAPDSGFRAFFHTTMDALDGANAWEMNHCRMKVAGQIVQIPETTPDYGDYSIKYHPAAGHVLGPVSMLLELGYRIDSDEVAQFIEYAKHYLIAMQLNDDMHDWKEDLQRGHISTTVAALLTALKEHQKEKNDIHLVDDMDMLDHLFWFDVLPSLCISVIEHVDAARKALSNLHFLEDIAPLEQFIVRNERIAREALAEQERTVAFLHQIEK